MIEEKEKRQMGRKHFLWIAIIVAIVLAAALLLRFGLPAASTTEHYDDETIAKAVEKYELKAPAYEPVAHEDLKKTIKQDSRYELQQDGIYYAEDSDPSETDASGDVVLMFTGDLMCQSRQQEAAYSNGKYGFTESFSEVRHILDDADLVVGNLETMLSDTSPYMSECDSTEGKPYCNGPSTYLDALRYAGFDALINANNHDADCGVKGIYETLNHLEEYDFAHTGTFGSDKEKRYIIMDVKGIKVGILAYATSFNRKDKNFTEKGKDVLLNDYSKEKMARDVRNARKDGAEYIVTYIHWGREHTNYEYEKQRNMAEEIAETGVDYIIGSHPHALQRYDVIESSSGKSVPVVYSMGNFVSHMKKTVNKDTIILRLNLCREDDGSVVLKNDEYIPCRIATKYKDKHYFITPVSRSYKDGALSDNDKAALSRIVSVMGTKLECVY